ncbi:pectinesterase-like [Silene latifolia]|uniref:pectinesterase-like n=1 Tax=Silene latifolia TaxID=37657 RepID=UPI003D772E9E
MEGNSRTAIDKNSMEPFKNSSKTTKNTTISLFLFFIILTIFTIIFSIKQHNSSLQETNQNPTILSLNPTIKTACAATLYPSLCLTTLSSSSANATTPHRLLTASIKHTIDRVWISQSEIVSFFAQQQLNMQETNALNDCLDMIDQTLYELDQALVDVRVSTRFLPHKFGNLKTLLSAAMTNENTCIDGFSDLDRFGPGFNPEKGFRIYLEIRLKPIIHMISNSLAIIKHMEMHDHGSIGGSMPTWISRKERKLIGLGNYKIKPNVVVASDRSGDYLTVGEAIKMAPNMSMTRYVIKIKAGVYVENVDVPRRKINIMLMGDGINSTVITGSRSFVDGFSTFTSATLTVGGDRFLARDLTIENTANPDKYQAVAARINSNSGFYRVNFTSHQDTLYAHSLRQFYRECIIEGTVDFIFGNAAAIFHNSQILVRKPKKGQTNMVTAQSRGDPNQNTGFSLQNCTIQASPDFTSMDRKRIFTFLGRPWRNYSRTIVTRSYLGDLIHPLGWSEWNEYSNLDTVEYIEYKNYGPGSDTRFRVGWKGYKGNCTEDVVKRFSVGAFLHTPEDWLNTTRFPLFHAQ